jgi:hypothetical protein
MTTAAAVEHNVDSILEQLGRFRQRATYGAVAGVVDTAPRSLMIGRERDQKSCWIVSRQTSLPTGYTPEQTHPEIGARDRVLSSPEELRVWLANPS